MRFPYAMLGVVSIAAGCGNQDPPCPPGAKNVSPMEADEGLARKAKREAAGGRDQGPAAEFDCLTIKSETVDGSNWANASGKVTVTFLDVIDCLAPALLARYTLTECIQHTARYRMAKRIVGDSAPDDAILKTMGITRCLEQSRNVEVSAEAHGLNRDGAGDWVPVILLLLQMAETGVSPALAPAMYLLKPAAGVEEACVDLPATPAKRCTDTTGCPGYEDAGAPDPDIATPTAPTPIPQDPGGGDKQ